MGYSNEKLDILDISFKICSLISLFGCIFIILVYIGYKHLRSVFFLIVVCMQIGDIIKSVSYFFLDKGYYCIFQGFLNNVGSLSAVTWSSIISISIYNAYISNEDQHLRFKKKYIFIGYGIPIIISIIPIITKNYDDIGGYCWIGNDYWYILQIFCLYFIIILSVIYNLRNYHLVIQEIRRQIAILPSSSVIEGSLQTMSRKFKTYPMILVICYGPSIFKMFFNAFIGESIILSLICGCLECLMGIFNTIVYACTPIVISAVANTLLCKRERTENKSQFTLILQDENKGSTFLRDMSSRYS